MRYKIETPVKGYTGKSASVPFVDGVGYTEKPELAEWFRSHGYKVTESGTTNESETEKASAEDAFDMEEPDYLPEPEKEPETKPKAGRKKV